MKGGFEHPLAFGLLLLVPVIAAFYTMALRSRRAAMAKLLGEAAAASLSRAPGRSRRALEAALATLTLCLVTIALAGPRWGREKERVRRSGADVVVVLDVSRSMLAQDVTPSRLDRARREIRGLMDSAAGDRLALVTFAGDARLVCPLTLDHDTLGMFVEEADPNVDHRGGSNLAAALDAAGLALDASSGAGKAVVVLSDGEDFGGGKGSAAVAAAARLAGKGARVHAIGLGTSTGAKIPTVDERGRSRFFVDPHGVEVLTKLESETLRAVAASGGGEYLEAASVAFPMDELWRKRISGLARSDSGSEEITSLEARFQWFLAPAILAASLWWMVPLGLFGAMRERRARAAIPAIAKVAAVLVLALSFFPRVAAADGVADGARGDALYRRGDFEGAAAAYDFASRGVAAPNGPFNLGNAKFRAKKFSEASRAWGEAEKRSVDPAIRRDASYNRGNALLEQAGGEDPKKADDLKAAVDAYSDALRQDPADADARRNRAIAIARWVDAKKPPPSGGKDGEKEKDPKQPPGNGQKQDPQAKKDDAGKGDGKPTPAPQPSPDGNRDSKQNAKDDAKDEAKQDAKTPQEPQGKPHEGQPPLNPQELERLERMLDQRERAQRQLEQRKARMHRPPGENEW